MISRKKILSPLLLVALLGSCSNETKITTSSPEALEYYTQGVNHLEKFYYAQAKEALERSVQVDSNFAMAYARLALVHYNSGNEAGANAEISKALVKSLGITKREQMFIRLLDHKVHFRFDEAGSVADSMIVLFPDDGELYFLRGNIFEYAKNFDAALETYRKGIVADTSYALAMMSLGYAYSSRGDFDKAIDAMERYISLVPDEPDPRASLADVLMRVGRYDDALAQYQQSLALKPDYWYSIGRIGDIYTILGRLNEADRQFDLALEKTVINNQARASHLATEGLLLFLRGRYDETIRLCEQSLALDSTNGRAAYVSVNALLKLKKYPEAQRMIDAIRKELQRRNLTKSIEMLQFHLLQGRYFEQQGLYEEALAHCDSAMEYGSEFTRSDVYHCLGKLHLERKEFDQSLDALERALRYNPNNPEALLTLTKVYRALVDKQMTSEIGGRLLDIWKNADADYQNLIELKRILGKPSLHSASR